MSNGLSVILTNRNEAMCVFTCKRILESATCPVQVIVVDDGSTRALRDMPAEVLMIEQPEPIGLAYCRDVGMLAAKHEACLVLDAHMNFHDDDWAPYCRDFAIDNPRALGCAVSVHLDSDPGNTPAQQMDMVHRWTVVNQGREKEPRGRSKYYGARIELRDPKYFRPFPCKWNGRYQDLIADGTPGTIQTILWGAYVLNRQWYIDGLKRPWELNRGWGTSEQTISIPNWLCGGESMLLPVEIGHQYRTGNRVRVPYSVSERMEEAILWNRWKIVETLPMSRAITQGLHAMLRDAHPADLDRYHNMLARFGEYLLQIRAYRDYLGSQPRTMADYFERWDMDTALPSLDEMGDN